jgi:hypothetical protein
MRYNMTQQSDSTRQKISAILNQIGMTDEELYQLLYGKKQQVEIEIALPQLMDEEIWLQTEHTEEELAHMSQQVSVLEQLVNTPPEGATLAALENLLEGEMIPDDARGFLLKKYFKNWRQGMAQFLAFLAFSKLQQLALALAALTAPNLMSQFEKTKNRPRDRELLANFILSQIEQPLPPAIGLMAQAGAILGATGSLEFHQPLTAALLQQSPDRIAKLLKILQTDVEIPSTETESPSDLSKIQNAKQKNQAIAQLSKLVLLDRVETMIANQQALQEQTQQQTTEQQQQQQQTKPRRNRVNRRQLREAAEREAQEKAIQHHQPLETEQARPTHAQRITNARPQPQPQPPVVVRKPVAPPSPPPKKQTSAATPDNNLKGLFADIPLAGLQGITVSNVDTEQLGKTKSSLPKDHSIKPTPSTERER